MAPQASTLVYVVSYIIALCSCCVAVHCLFLLLSTFEFIMCQEMSLAPFCSLDALFWVCFRMFQGRNGYFGYPGKSQNLLSFSSTRLANEKGPPTVWRRICQHEELGLRWFYCCSPHCAVLCRCDTSYKCKPKLLGSKWINNKLK